MNGVYNLVVGDKTYVLKFGYNACAEFELRYYFHIKNGVSPNQAILTTDLVYSGIYCEAIRTSSAIPKYEDVFDIVETLSESDDFKQVETAIWSTYQESKMGSEFVKRAEEIVKKKEELELAQEQASQ